MLFNPPIAVFDSGIGGLTTLCECMKALSNEDFLYFADNANCPYGSKQQEKIQKHTFASIERIATSNPKLLVVACNTATAAAVQTLREKYNKFLIVGTEPAILPALKVAKRKVLVLTTLSTATNKYFLNRFCMVDKDAYTILALPNLAKMIDNGERGEKITSYINKNLKQICLQDFDTIVLGCTHFLFVKEEISQASGIVNLIDGNDGVARQVKKLLTERNLLTKEKSKGILTVELSNPLPKEYLKYANLIKSMR